MKTASAANATPNWAWLGYRRHTFAQMSYFCTSLSHRCSEKFFSPSIYYNLGHRKLMAMKNLLFFRFVKISSFFKSGLGDIHTFFMVYSCSKLDPNSTYPTCLTWLEPYRKKFQFIKKFISWGKFLSTHLTRPKFQGDTRASLLAPKYFIMCPKY